MMDLRPLKMFHSPESWDELMDWINLEDREARRSLITSAAMGFNMAVSMTSELNKGVSKKS